MQVSLVQLSLWLYVSLFTASVVHSFWFVTNLPARVCGCVCAIECDVDAAPAAAASHRCISSCSTALALVATTTVHISIPCRCPTTWRHALPLRHRARWCCQCNHESSRSCMPVRLGGDNGITFRQRPALYRHNGTRTMMSTSTTTRLCFHHQHPRRRWGHGRYSEHFTSTPALWQQQPRPHF
jgi:hypothetical protein